MFRSDARHDPRPAARSAPRSAPRRAPSRAPRRLSIAAIAALLAAAPALAGADEADVVGVELTPLGDNRFRVDATVAHADEGWDHYADRWDVYDEGGSLLGTRELAHPHENEQPFTRSATVEIPEGVRRIEVRAHDSVHGEGGESFSIDVPR